ncbi:MAG: HlyD family efflux transporter periplasmic adaptor subunit [Bacteroidales bacterium]
MTLKKERNIRISKWVLGVVMVCLTGLVIGLLTKPTVDRRGIMFSKADKGSIELSVSASGKIVPAFEEIISSPIDSRIVEVYKKGGDSVIVGTPILKLDLLGAENAYRNMVDQEKMKVLELNKLRLMNRGRISKLEMSLKVQRMELNRKEVNFRNEKYLDSLGSGTTDRVLEAELGYKVGALQLKEDEQNFLNEKQLAVADIKVKELDLSIFRKELQQVRKTYEDARIQSPRKGILTFVFNEIGGQVGRGSKVAIVSDLSHFKVEGEISDSYGSKISVGYKALLKFGRERLIGVVSNLTPLSRNGMLSFSVQLTDDNNPVLRSGLKGEVYILNSVKEDVVRIANGDYYNGPGEYKLYVLNGNELNLRTVQLGECNFEYVEVISGIEIGTQIAVRGDLPKGKKQIRLH